MGRGRLISLLCAAVLCVPLFTGIFVTVGAADEVLFADSFNSYVTSRRERGGTVFAGNDGGWYSQVEGNEDLDWIFNSPSEAYIGDRLIAGNADGDDTGFIMIVENEDDAADKFLQMRRNRYANRTKPDIEGFDKYKAKDGEELVIAFDLQLRDTAAAAEQGIASAIEFCSGSPGELVTLSSIDTSIAVDGEWIKVRVVVKDGKTDIYSDGEIITRQADGVLSAIRPLPFNKADTRIGNGTVMNYPVVNIDNLVIMSSADGANAAIPDANKWETPTPSPTPSQPEKAEITQNGAAGVMVSGLADGADAKIIHAKYSADGALASVQFYAAENGEIPIKGMANGDKIMLWDNSGKNGIQPLCPAVTAAGI